MKSEPSDARNEKSHFFPIIFMEVWHRLCLSAFEFLQHMARSRSGYYNTIEYIGPRPRKPKKPNFFGGWVIVAITLLSATFFVKPWIGSLLAAENGPTEAQAQIIAGELDRAGTPGDRLAAEALRYSNLPIAYDSAYYKIDFPAGDVPQGKGVAADLVIRCFRKTGTDLQLEVNADMKTNRNYPQLWGSNPIDTNIDHRRVPNLKEFFKSKGETLTTGRDLAEYKSGDVVVWVLPNAEIHIGIVVPGPDGADEAPWVVHHPSGGGVKWEDALFDHQILGHFRYPAG